MNFNAHPNYLRRAATWRGKSYLFRIFAPKTDFVRFGVSSTANLVWFLSMLTSSRGKEIRSTKRGFRPFHRVKNFSRDVSYVPNGRSTFVTLQKKKPSLDRVIRTLSSGLFFPLKVT